MASSSAFQDIKCEPGLVELVDLGPFLLGNEVKVEPKTGTRKRATTAKRRNDFSETDESRYRDIALKNYFGCRFCPIMYQSQRQLVGHVRQKHRDDSKTDETIYEKCYQPMDNNLMVRCKMCDSKQTFSYREFKRHVYKSHETRKTCKECPVCGGFFASSQTLQKHEATKHAVTERALPVKARTRVKCQHCPLDYADVRNLRHHQYSKHKMLVKGAPPTQDHPKDCELCGKKLRNANSLWSHKRIAHHVELNLTKPQPTFNHQCPKCPLKFKWASNLSRHRRQAHENVQYTCKLCKKSFGTRQTIYSHSFTHTKLVRYKCSEPDCRFKNMLKSKYVEHLRDEHEVDFDQEKHDPDRQKFAYQKLIDYCCKSVPGKDEPDTESSDSEKEWDSDEI